MQVKRVKLSVLKSAEHNPKSRTTKASIKTLIQSISEVGLIYPIAVSKGMEIIDGHRRVAAAKALGWEEIPVLVIATDDNNAIYAAVNSNAKIMSGTQILSVYLKEPEAVAVRARSRLKRFEERFGRRLLRHLLASGLSVAILNVAIQISRYVDDDSSVFVNKSIKWMIKCRNAHFIRAYMRLGNDPAALYDAIKKNKTTKMIFN